MTNAPNMSEATEPRTVARGGALYRLIWKWHFLAGLLVLPFMAFMAITGIVNLFHDELTEMLYADRLNVPAGEQTLAYEDIATLQKNGFTGRAVKTDLGDKGVWYRVYVGGFANRTEAEKVRDGILELPEYRYAQVKRLP